MVSVAPSNVFSHPIGSLMLVPVGFSHGFLHAKLVQVDGWLLTGWQAKLG
jgi:hypothetical protein